MKLKIVIVNFRTPDLTVQCLESLRGDVAAIGSSQVIVVENGSGDDSAEQIDAAIELHGWRDWVELLVLADNMGFAGGNNRGIEHGEPAEFTLLLNSDTIVDAGCLVHCLECMESNPDIGILGCRVKSVDGSLQSMARKFPTPMRTIISAMGLPWRFPRLFKWADADDEGWDRATTTRDVDWLVGVFMLIRRDLIEKTGALDEDFFFYGEDIEFCHRAQRAGVRRHYDPTTAITHLGGGSSDPERLSAAKRSLHQWRARYLVQRKCYGRLAAAVVRTVDLIMWGLRLCWLRLTGRRSAKRYEDARSVWSILRGKLV